MAAKKSVRNLSLKLQVGTQKTLYARWDAPSLTGKQKKYLKEYKVQWYWAAKGGPYYPGSNSSGSSTNATYSMPDKAIKAKVVVTPVSSKSKKWSGAPAYREFSINKTVPNTPSTPSISIDGIKATISVSNYDSGLNTSNVRICIEIVQDGIGTPIRVNWLKVQNGGFRLIRNLNYGHRYTVRARAWNADARLYSDWSSYSSEVKSAPSIPKTINNPSVKSDSSVVLSWSKVTGADKYTVEYTTNPAYFNKSPNNVSSTSVEKAESVIITGLEKGHTYYFRVKAITDNAGESGWTKIVSVILGTVPSAPTTWSSTSTAKVGDKITLYWVHNSQDNSSQTDAEILLTITENGNTNTVTKTWHNDRNEDDKNKTVEYPLDISAYTSGAVIKWKVRTKGVLNTYSEWSVEREIDIYATPVITVVSDITDGILTSFPIKIEGTAGPVNQKAISYYCTIVSKSNYTTYDSTGAIIKVYQGDTVYTKQFNANGNQFTIDITPEDVDLENDATYEFICTVAMDSGLTAQSEPITFEVQWEEDSITIFGDAEWLDEDAVAVSVFGYCINENGICDPSFTISVYRKDFEGKYIEIQTGMSNSIDSICIDSHPPLNQVSYRIVAKSSKTGKLHFYDTDPFEVNKSGIYLQWDDQNSDRELTIDYESDAVAENDTFTTSIVKLPYNVEVSPTHDVDVALIKYIGREHPVSYYGTQLGETATVNAEILKDDYDTLDMIRRLAVYKGDVYFRESSGMGYWAQAKVSYNRKYNTLTIPISISITRVEGGK